MPMSRSETKISVQVYPNAARSEVAGFADGVLRVKVAAPPVKGKANRELIAVLSQALGTDRGKLSIIKGQTSRSKIVAVDGLSREEITKMLSSSDGGASR